MSPGNRAEFEWTGKPNRVAAAIFFDARSKRVDTVRRVWSHSRLNSEGRGGRCRGTQRRSPFSRSGP